MKTQQVEALESYEEGYLLGLSGQEVGSEACCYEFGSQEYVQFMRGWRDGVRHFREDREDFSFFLSSP